MRRGSWSMVAVIVGSALVVAACGSGTESSGSTTTAVDTPPTVPGYVSDTYLDQSAWLCLPGSDDDLCTTADLTATDIKRDLSTVEVPFEAAAAPTADCFYVYGSLTTPGDGANRTPDADRTGEEAAVRDEAARFGASCRVFAPWYPQAVVAPGAPASPEAGQIAYDAVLDAFLHYLDQYNGGRPFVLLGHGQGADLLARVVQAEIDTDPDRLPRLLSAMLVGTTNVFVPTGAGDGGTFQNLGLCSDRSQTQCLVAFHSFQRGVPPPVGGGPLYAAVPEGMAVPCTNPAGLDGSKGQFRGSYFPSNAPGLPPVATAFALYREYYRGECATRNGASYVAVDVTTDPSDVRPLGPIESAPGQEAGLGLFAVEWNMALGDLVDLVDTQASTFG